MQTDPIIIVAGPLGYYGTVYGRLFFGPRRDTKSEALDDAILALELTSSAGFAGLQFAWSSIR